MKRDVLVFGGSGALGSAVCRALGRSHRVISIDSSPSPFADSNLDFQSLSSDSTHLIPGLKAILGSSGVEAIVSAGGAAEACRLGEPEAVASLRRMNAANLSPALAAAHAAAKLLSPGGKIFFTGSLEAFEGPCPLWVTHALAKNSVHSLALQLAKDADFQSKDLRSICLLPALLDTPENRALLEIIGKKELLPPELVAEMLSNWLGGAACPVNGALVKLGFANGFLQVSSPE